MMMPSISRARLRQMATGGTASIGVSVAATNVLRIVSSMTLTRLLSSYDYGVVGVITSVAFMLGMLSDLGLTPFVVRHPDGDDRDFLDELWTLYVVRGVLLALGMALVAGPAAAFLEKPELNVVIAVWGLNFILMSLQSLAHSTGIRNRQLWRLSLLDFITNATTFAFSLIGAILLRSYWAIIVGMFAGSIVRTFLSYPLFPASLRRWRINRARAAELWRFSRYITVSSILTLLIMQSDQVILARMMPLATFGLYSIAVTLAAAPAALAGPYATRVLYAIYAEAVRNSPGLLKRIFYDARRRVTLLYMFSTASIIGAAPAVIEILYDDRYRGVVLFLRLIMISAVLRLPSLAADQVLIAVGRTQTNLYANICRVLWLMIGGAAGVWTGSTLLLVATVGTIEVPGILCSWWNLARANLLDIAEESFGLLAAVIGIGAGYAASWVLMEFVIPYLA